MRHFDPRHALRRSGAWIDRQAEITSRVARSRNKQWRAKAIFIAQSAIAAGLSFFIARDILDVAAPMYAPIASILTLGFSYGERLRRAAEITVGVAIGAVIAEIFILYVGMGVWQVTALAAIAMSIAAWLGAGTLMINQAGIQGLVIALLAGHSGTPEGRWVEALVGAGTGMLLASLIPSSVLRRPQDRSTAVLESLSTLFITTASAIRSHDTKMAETSLASARRLEKDLDTLRGYAADSLDIATWIPWYRSKRPAMQRLKDQLVPIDRAVRNARVLLRRGTIAVQVDEAVPEEYLDCMWDLAYITDQLSEYTRDGSALPEIEAALHNLSVRTAAPAPGSDLSAEVIRAQIRSILVDYHMVLGDTHAEAQARVRSGVKEHVRDTEAAIHSVLDTLSPETGALDPVEFTYTGIMPVVPVDDFTY